MAEKHLSHKQKHKEIANNRKERKRRVSTQFFDCDS
jgi:hypothetical protein